MGKEVNNTVDERAIKLVQAAMDTLSASEKDEFIRLVQKLTNALIPGKGDKDNLALIADIVFGYTQRMQHINDELDRRVKVTCIEGAELEILKKAED